MKMIYKNKTNQIQCININNRSINFSPGEFVSDEIVPALSSMTSVFQKGHTLYQHLNAFPYAKVNIGRSFALGDVIMTFVLCRWLSYQFPMATITMYTKAQYAEVFKVACSDVKVYAYQRGEVIPPSDYSINLNGSMELDHRKGNYSELHRVHIALSVLGFPMEEWPRAGQINWNFHIGNANYAFGSKWRHDFLSSLEPNRKQYPMAAIQARGSNKVKTLPRHILEQVIYDMSLYANVVVITNDIRDKFDIPNTRTAYNLNINQTMALIYRCDVLVCMDSGPLWMAHVVKTPFILISGPTVADARTSLFSMKEKYSVIRAEQWVNCTPCNERGEACNKNFTCIRNINATLLKNSIRTKFNLAAGSKRLRRIEYDREIRSKQIIKTERLESIMEHEEEILLPYSSSAFLCRHGYTFTLHHGDIVYDMQGKSYPIEVNMFGMWVTGADSTGRDANYHMNKEKFIPAVELTSAVVFIKNMGYNDLQKFNLDRISENIDCKYLETICKKVMRLRDEMSVPTWQP